jgi:thiamine-phosphate pyrophosphorylase
VSWTFEDRSLYLCTPLRDDLVAFVTECVHGGVDVVQLREKHADDGPLLAAATLLAARCGDLGVPFLVNDRPDIALAAGADGVHVGQGDLPPAVCRALLGDHAVIGLSTHAPVELDAAITAPVTYLSAGPVQATPTKPGRPGTGVEYASLAARLSPVPVFVTGGVTPSTIPALAASGVRHFVVVRALTEAADPRAAAHELRAAIETAVPRTTS